MQKDELELPIGRVPYFELGKKSDLDPIHFTGANGFPAGSYLEFLNGLSDDYFVSAADCRGAWSDVVKPTKHLGFEELANDLIQVIESQYDRPIIGMGHSFGAHVSLIAAIKRPDLFSRLVLLDPASLPNLWMDIIYRRLPQSIVDRLVPMIKQTRQRKRVWASKEEFIENYRGHRTFQHFTASSLRNYAEYGLVKENTGDFRLVFDPDWESHIFSQVHYVWKNLKKVSLPTLFVKAQHSYLYSSEQFQRRNNTLPDSLVGIELDTAYHMFPLEQPEASLDIIRPWLARTK